MVTFLLIIQAKVDRRRSKRIYESSTLTHASLNLRHPVLKSKSGACAKTWLCSFKSALPGVCICPYVQIKQYLKQSWRANKKKPFSNSTMTWTVAYFNLHFFLQWGPVKFLSLLSLKVSPIRGGGGGEGGASFGFANGEWCTNHQGMFEIVWERQILRNVAKSPLWFWAAGGSMVSYTCTGTL